MEQVSDNHVYNFKLIIISYILPLILQIGLFVFQLVKGIISFWSVVGTCVILSIFIYIIKNAKANKNKQNKVKFYKNNDKNNKKSKKFIIINSIITSVLIALSILFLSVYQNKISDAEVVICKVVSQSGGTDISIDETDEGTVVSESDYVKVEVEYQFNGKTKTALIKGSTTDKIYVDHLKIYIDENGDFVSDYGRFLVWKLEGILFLCVAIVLFLYVIFKFKTELFAGMIFFSVSLAVLFLVCSQFIENSFYNDVVCFLGAFVNIGLYMISYGFMDVFCNRQKQALNEAVDSITIEEKLYQTKNKTIKNLQKDGIICVKCGKKINSSDKFCYNCGHKHDKTFEEKI